MGVDLSIIVDDERIEIIVFKAVTFQKRLPGIGLQRSKLKMPLSVPIQDKIHRAAAKITVPIEEDQSLFHLLFYG